MLKLTFALAVLILPAATFAGEIYKWTDANGETHFSDRANSAAKKVDVRPTRPLPPQRKISKHRVAAKVKSKTGVTRIISQSKHE